MTQRNRSRQQIKPRPLSFDTRVWLYKFQLVRAFTISFLSCLILWAFFQSVHVSGPVSSLSRLFSWIQLRPVWDPSPFRFCVLLKRQTNEEFAIIQMQKNTHQKQIVSHGGRGQTAHICFLFSVSFIKRKLNDIYNDLPPRVALDFVGSFLFTHNAAVRIVLLQSLQCFLLFSSLWLNNDN